MRNDFGVSSSVKVKYLHLLARRELTISQIANVMGDRMNEGVRILPLPSFNGLLGRRMSGQRSAQLVLRI